MEVELKISSEDHLLLQNVSKENESEERNEDNIIKSVQENLKDNIIYSQNFKETDYSYNLHKSKNNEYTLELNCNDKIKEEIKNKFNSCSEKEKILNNKEKEFQKLQNDLIIDENLLEKKLMSLIRENKNEYDDIINKIIEFILDYENFSKEYSLLQEKMIKYRSSSILQLCFKIYWHRLHNCILYVLQKYIIFLYNENIFKMVCKIIPKLIKIIIDDIFDIILKKLSQKQIFLKHKGDYQKKIKLYRDFCYLFFILQSFDKNSENIIFNIDKDINLEFSENKHDNIGKFNFHILNRTGLNVSLESFKERVNMDEILASHLKKILLLYQRYKTTLSIYKISRFLYD
jgi:hypothetical protein